MLDYDLETPGVVRFLRRTKASRVGVQLPAGLRPLWSEIAETISGCGAEPLFLGTCYGSCDLADEMAKRAGCDALLHYGHSDMGLSVKLPVKYIEARVREITLEPLKKLAKRTSEKRVLVFTTVQYIGHLPRVIDKLRELGFQPFTGPRGSRTKYPGQILGCDFTCVKNPPQRPGVLLYIGSGRFHPLGAALATHRQVYIADPIGGKLSQIGGLGDFIHERKVIISRAAGASRIGVVGSSKRGQARLGLAHKLVQKLRAAGKKTGLVVLDEITPEGLGDYSFEAVVCTACPRIAIDDVPRYEVPILTPFEASVMLGEVGIEDYQMDEIRSADSPKV